MIRVKGLLGIVSIAVMVGIIVVGGSRVEAKAKSSACTEIKVTKNNISSSKKKAWNLYKKGKPFTWYGKRKYYKKVTSYVTKRVMKENGVKWVPPLSTYNKKEIKAYKTNVKYLGKIVKDIRANYKVQMSNPSYRRYWDYFTGGKDKRGKVYASVIDDYMCSHMHYIKKNKYSNTDYKKIYTKTYESACNGDTIVGVGIIKALGFKARKKYYYEDNHVVPQMQISVNNKKHWVTLYGGAEGNDNCVFDVMWDEQLADSKTLTDEEYFAKYPQDRPETTTPDTSDAPAPTVTEEEKKVDEDARKWQDDFSNVNPDDLVIDMGDYFGKTDE